MTHLTTRQSKLKGARFSIEDAPLDAFQTQVRTPIKRGPHVSKKKRVRMTAQDRRDVAEAERILSNPNLKLTDYSEVRRELGLA